MNDLLYAKIMASGNEDEQAQCRAYVKEEDELQEAKTFNKIRIAIFLLSFVVGSVSGEINPESASVLIFIFIAYEFGYYTKTKENIIIKTTLATFNVKSDNIREDYCYFRSYL